MPTDRSQAYVITAIFIASALRAESRLDLFVSGKARPVRHQQLKDPASFDVVVDTAFVAELTSRPETSQPERAVPDVPASIGLMLIGVYVAIVGLFALTIATAGQGPFMIAIDVAFLAAFFSVPMIMLKQEKDMSRRPTLGRFMAQGMQTYTGHISGGGALAQMFVVPVSLAFGVLAIGIISWLV